MARFTYNFHSEWSHLNSSFNIKENGWIWQTRPNNLNWQINTIEFLCTDFEILIGTVPSIKPIINESCVDTNTVFESSLNASLNINHMNDCLHHQKTCAHCSSKLLSPMPLSLSFAIYHSAICVDGEICSSRTEWRSSSNYLMKYVRGNLRTSHTTVGQNKSS